MNIHSRMEIHYAGKGTRLNPIKVMERPIRQQIKVIKDIQTNPDGSYAHDTYSAVHKENLSADGYNRWYTKVTDWLDQPDRRNL